MNTPRKQDDPSGFEGLPPEFYTLVERKVSGDIDAADLARLEHHLLADERARAYLTTLCVTETLLPAALRRCAQDPGKVACLPWRRRAIVAMTLAAACASLAVGLFLSQRGGEPGSGTVQLPSAGMGPYRANAGEVPARVTRVYGLAGADASLSEDCRLATPEVRLDAGLVELNFDSGARVILEGPASFTVTGPNSARIDKGRLVAEVPVPAHGFILDCPGGRVTDRGTRFAVEAGEAKTFVGVLDGRVDFTHGEVQLPLFQDYAVEMAGGALRSVPLDFSRFVERMPGQELPWSLTGRELDEPVILRYDVSALMRAQGDLYLVIKWLGGNDALNIRELRLLHDGKVQQVVAGEVVSGDVRHTHANALRLPIQTDAPRRGIWTLELDAVCLRTETDPPDRKSCSEGIIQICRQPAFVPSRADFVGSWMGSNEGSVWVRTFNADGTATLMHGGRDHWGDAGARWRLENGELVVSFAQRPLEVPERHMLINRNTLVFLNRPYRNAHRK